MRSQLILNKWRKLFNNYNALSEGDLSFVEMSGICLSSRSCGRLCDISGLILDGIHFAFCLRCFALALTWSVKRHGCVLHERLLQWKAH